MGVFPETERGPYYDRRDRNRDTCHPNTPERVRPKCLSHQKITVLMSSSVILRLGGSVTPHPPKTSEGVDGDTTDHSPVEFRRTGIVPADRSVGDSGHRPVKL